MDEHSRLSKLTKILQEDPGDSFARFALAKEYEGSGDIEQAINHLAILRQKDPDYIGLYYHLGKLLESQGNRDEAVRVYKAGIQLAGGQGDAHSERELKAALENLVL